MAEPAIEGGAEALPGASSRALESYLARLLPKLLTWASGRLPRYARRRVDTGDLVQEAVVQALRQLGAAGEVEPETLRRYVLKCIFNRIRDEVRRAKLGEVRGGDLSEAPDSRGTPLDDAIASEKRRRYREAFLRLDEEDQVLLVGRVDLEMTYLELAVATRKPNAEAARSATRRAALKLAARIGERG